MANPEHLDILKQGKEKWNEWRINNSNFQPDLSNTDLSQLDLSLINFNNASLIKADLSKSNLFQAELTGADLTGAKLINTELSDALLSLAKLSGADLSGAGLVWANLYQANLSRANLAGARFMDASLREADFSNANLSKANLSNANLSGANLTGADLTGADLTEANCVETNFSHAIITDCSVYGISAWNLILKNTIQRDLVITKIGEPIITVDDLLVAQFIYLLLNNKNIRNVIESITSKGVLILGRFNDRQRKAVLDGLRDKLRNFDLLPIVFDFDRPTDKDYTETIQTLAGMCKFVIADITDPKSTPLELEAIVKHFKIPFLPIIDISVDARPFAMLVDSQKSFHWVLPTLKYKSKEELLDDENLQEYIIDLVNKKREELRLSKNTEPDSTTILKKS